jgi:hypothetical protein
VWQAQPRSEKASKDRSGTCFSCANDEAIGRIWERLQGSVYIVCATLLHRGHHGCGVGVAAVHDRVHENHGLAQFHRNRRKCESDVMDAITVGSDAEEVIRLLDRPFGCRVDTAMRSVSVSGERVVSISMEASVKLSTEGSRKGGTPNRGSRRDCAIPTHQTQHFVSGRRCCPAAARRSWSGAASAASPLAIICGDSAHISKARKPMKPVGHPA